MIFQVELSYYQLNKQEYTEQKKKKIEKWVWMMVNSGVRWLTKFLNFSQKISKSGGLDYSLTKLSPPHKCCIYWVGLDLCKPIIVIFPHPNPTGIRDRQFGTSVQDISQQNKHEGRRRNLPSIFESYLGVMRIVNTWENQIYIKLS